MRRSIGPDNVVTSKTATGIPRVGGSDAARGSMSVPFPGLKGASVTAPISKGASISIVPSSITRQQSVPTGELQRSPNPKGRSLTPPAPAQHRSVTPQAHVQMHQSFATVESQTAPTTKCVSITTVAANKPHLVSSELQTVSLTKGASVSASPMTTHPQTCPTSTEVPVAKGASVTMPAAFKSSQSFAPRPSSPVVGHRSSLPEHVGSSIAFLPASPVCGYRSPSPEHLRPSSPVCGYRSPSPEQRFRDVTFDASTVASLTLRRSPEILLDERIAGPDRFTCLQQQVAALDQAFNRVATRCSTIEQELANKNAEHTRLRVEFEALLKSQALELETKIDATVESLANQLAEKIQALGSGLTANLDGRLREMLDRELSVDASAVQKISDHVIIRVNEDPRICQVVESHKSLHESFTRLSVLLEKSSPPVERTQQSNDTSVNMLHELVVETEKCCKAMSVELRQMRQRRNQDFSDTAIRFSTIENKFKSMQAKFDESCKALPDAASDSDVVKMLGAILKAPEQDSLEHKHDTTIDEETDGYSNC